MASGDPEPASARCTRAWITAVANRPMNGIHRRISECERTRAGGTLEAVVVSLGEVVGEYTRVAHARRLRLYLEEGVNGIGHRFGQAHGHLHYGLRRLCRLLPPVVHG